MTRKTLLAGIAMAAFATVAPATAHETGASVTQIASGKLSQSFPADEIMSRLRKWNLPVTVIDVAERLYRLWRLNKLDVNLQAILRRLDIISTEVAAGRMQVSSLELEVMRHSAWIASIEAMASRNAERLDGIRRELEVSQRDNERLRLIVGELNRLVPRTRICPRFHVRRDGACVDWRLQPVRAD